MTDDFSGVTFLVPFDDFSTPTVPQDVDTYTEYRRRSIEFVTARNRRIAQTSTSGTNKKPAPATRD